MEVSKVPKDVLGLGRQLVRELGIKDGGFRVPRRHGILTQLEHVPAPQSTS